ncbi:MULTISPECIES: GTP cyclohydrolase FolE2 [unclassified Pseudomonas]|uniref:GTP cyclohydrolase FolE2 n=1 Tax=unclassified Pseudomonas TaxID=196821 RepID=UPI000BCF3ABE|nr:MULTISPECIES: GTP cyclohydrolase FolE2 [unclassified Pseudomonas]PVZ13622.1 GTP cyclohydrolase I [Pseudomonas sp. URIL14HWK12:I12]PVZ23928.1 GTP cyclohydrolase I [Pseudomonas sp. URIL14HWK12:I10]PVZ33433.1 GTP cyclohydrolase I [Pseudomonas sp. URIL14HWK12:I11]SNZ11536.1 GTP cyclohydrolase I [Pseudomonas sp. URIL14HWK12:I9]
MNLPLPDVARYEQPVPLAALDAVGMRGIDLPLWLAEPCAQHPVHARADLFVDLPDPRIKGIHMSRLYRLLAPLGSGQRLSPAVLSELTAEMLHSHADCQAGSAQACFRFDWLRQRPALVTPGLAGWAAYPIALTVKRQGASLSLTMEACVTYSSTCPCSAALARQVIEQRFLADFAGQNTLPTEFVANWLRAHASAATPHSQRSVARIRVAVAQDAPGFGLEALIARAEQALGTPVQTAVKRADEQAFAQRNGEHLMYVEDASRVLLEALRPHYEGLQVHVSHQESLHPHDAVAWGGAA